MKRTGSWVAVSWVMLAGAVVSCSDNGELFGSRQSGGSGGALGGMGTGGTGTTPGSGGANGGTTPGGAPGTGGTSAGSSTVGTGGQAGTGSRGGAGAGPSETTGGAAGEPAGAGGMTGGAGGKSGGGVGGMSGASAGSAGESNAGSGGAAGGAATCPTDCKVSPLVSTCSSGESVWECGSGYKHQEMLDAGCRDLGTAIQRFCCPEESYPHCTSGVACAQVNTQAECDARTDCHSVFTDPHNCKCAAIGCCARFSRCADGALANCSDANVSCDALTPYCESPAYVVAYAGICYEGCARAADCAP